MTSRFTLLASVAGLALAGCSAPAEEGEPGPAPLLPPPGFQAGAGGTTGQVGVAGTGGGTAATAGTGGGAPVANAGAGGSAVATAGAGGAPAGGAGGGGGAIPTGTGNLIMHDAMGWVAGATNAVGIQGSFYSFSDADGTPPGVTTITMDDFAASPVTACASGVASAVPDDTGYAQFWGGGIGLNLADAGGTAGLGPWTPGTVTGFTFTITGPMIPPGLRFNATTPADVTYCDNLAAGANTLTLGGLTQECYNTPPGAAFTAGTTLESIQWQVVTVLAASTPFDFCIENLTAVTAP